MTVSEIAAMLSGDVVGNGALEVGRVAKIEEAGPGDLTFLANPKYERYLSTTKASAVLVSKTSRVAAGGAGTPTLIKVDDPYLGFLKIHKRLTPEIDPFPSGIHPSAVISPSATIGARVDVGAWAIVGDGAVIGNGSRIGEGSYIGRDAKLGESCLIYPHVTIYHQCRIGNRVVIHSGTVIGSDGFGFAPRKDGTYEKIPQLGIVTIEDDVEIGSNCSVDRATLGETLIQRGVKLDNLIQVAHNVVIGENTVIASQTGISGSTKIGKNVMIAGQVGFAGHLEIADKTVFYAQSGVPKSLTEPGKVYFGYPAKERSLALRIEAVVRSLPELAADVRELQRQVAELLKKLSKS